MDVSKAKRIITPAGELKRILSGGVVIWQKASAPQYEIWKDSELIDVVTMEQFVDRIHSGYAEENYGIGAQIIVPYGNQKLPFNFGTFTAYGEGKLGLQAAYEVPSSTQSYGTYTQKDSNDKNNYCAWKSSKAKTYLNSSFLNALPSDFVSRIQSTTTLGATQKIFLLSAAQFYANATYTTQGIYQNSGKYTITPTDNSGSPWEYWKKRMGAIQSVNETKSQRKSQRKSYKLIEKNKAIFIILPVIATIPAHTSNGVSYAVQRLMYAFDATGKFIYNAKATTGYFYLPACVIG